MYRGHQVQVTLFAWSYAKKKKNYVHSQPLSIGTVELVDNSDSQSENKPERRRDENQTGGNALWQSVLTVVTELALRLVSWT